MAFGWQETTGQGEEPYARARRARCRTPPTPLGPSRKELRLRLSRRQENSCRPVRRQNPARRLSLHVRPGVERRLPQLLIQHGSYGWCAGAFGTTRRFLCSGFTTPFIKLEG